MMAFSQIEELLINSSFLTLFLNTIVVWIGYSFNPTFFKKSFLIILNSIPSFLTATFLLIRWYNSGHFPISNLYESLIFLGFCINLVLIFVYISTKNLILYAVSLPVPLFISAFANFCLPGTMQAAAPLIPALKSNWLLMHVSVMIISYASLIIGSLFSIAFLVIWFLDQKALSISSLETQVESTATLSQLPLAPETVTVSNLSNASSTKFTSLLDNLDNLSYRFIGISFPFLTIGILSGAVWANETWGSYWNWDPKETWALITWLVFAMYLHTRLIKGSKGFIPSVIGTVGFVIVWICYLGVNLLGKGLHSYGWFNS
jgi:cytochrome c-type biogenesis protein CcsB